MATQYKFSENILATPFWSFKWEFSVRLNNCLINLLSKDVTLKEVIDTSNKQYMRQPMLGRKSLNELRAAVGYGPEYDKEKEKEIENAST